MKKKITAEQLVYAKNLYLERKADMEEKIRKPYDLILEQFLRDHTEGVEIGKVYELVKGGIQRKGVKRFITTGFRLIWFTHHPIIDVELSWIDEEGKVKMKRKGPMRDSFSIFGVGNPAVFKLSENQLIA